MTHRTPYDPHLSDPTRRQVLATTAAATALQLLGGCSSAPGARRPNLLFVLSDAHRASTAACYGDGFAVTPHMDALARDGMRLTTAISNTPVCRPYRASLMTGALGHHCGLVGNWSDHNLQDTVTDDSAPGTMPRGRQWTPSGLPTLASVFSSAGYRCGYVGKWHLGRVDVDPGPLRMGFDDYWAVSAEPAHEYWNWSYFTGAGPAIEGTEVFKPAVDTNLATEFMDQDDGRPWFLMVSWGPPHKPYEAPPRFRHFDHVKPPPNVPGQLGAELAGYYAMVEAIDHQLGRLLAQLDQRGLVNDTIVVYTSDHGSLVGSHRTFGKELPFDGATRVPFLARWPGHITAGRTLAAPLGTPDILPTLSGLAGLTAPSVPDGLDLSQLLLGQRDARSSAAAYMAGYVRPDKNNKPVWRGLRTERHLFACTEQGPWMLYDMLEDPHELKNLVKTGSPKVARLHDRLLGSMSDLGDVWLV